MSLAGVRLDAFFFLRQLPDFPRRVASSGDVLPSQLGIAFGLFDVREAEDLRKFVKIASVHAGDLVAGSSIPRRAGRRHGDRGCAGDGQVSVALASPVPKSEGPGAPSAW